MDGQLDVLQHCGEAGTRGSAQSNARPSAHDRCDLATRNGASIGRGRGGGPVPLATVVPACQACGRTSAWRHGPRILSNIATCNASQRTALGSAACCRGRHCGKHCHCTHGRSDLHPPRVLRRASECRLFPWVAHHVTVTRVGYPATAVDVRMEHLCQHGHPERNERVVRREGHLHSEGAARERRARLPRGSPDRESVVSASISQRARGQCELAPRQRSPHSILTGCRRPPARP